MIDLHTEDLREDDEEEDVLRQAYVIAITALCKLRIQSEMDDRSYCLAVECLEEITQVMAEYSLCIEDELIDEIYWKAENG